MIRLSLLLFILLLSGSAIHSQSITYSTKQKITSKAARFSIIGKNNDGIILRRYGKTTNILDIFDDNLNYKYSVPINPRRQNAFTKGILLNQTGATSLFLAPEKDHMVLYARVLKQRFEIDGSTEIPLDTVFDGRDNTIQNYRYILSKDRSKILLFCPVYKGNEASYIQMKVYTRDLLLLQKKKINIKDELKSQYLSFHPLVKNNGEALLYIINNVKTDKTAFSLDGVHQHHLAYNGYSYKKLNYQITAFGSVSFKYDEENKRVCMAGLSSGGNKKSRRSSTGYFVNFINADSSRFIVQERKKYSNSFMYELTGKDSTKHNGQLSTFDLKRVVLRKDGGAILIMESFFTENDQISFQSGNHPSFTNFRTYNVFYYNDVVCFSVDDKGQQQWHSILRKKQISENDNGIYSSFGLLIESDELNFVYLDEIFYSANVNSYILNSEGKLRRKSLFNQGDDNLMVIPRLAKQIANDVILIPSLRKNMLSMVKIDL